MPALLVAVFLVAHGVVHLLFLSPQPPASPDAPHWPFSLAGSRILGRLGIEAPAARTIGVALLVVLLAGYSGSALAVLGLLPATVFEPLVIAASAASLALLGLFFDRWLLIGIAIDVVLLWLVVVAGWNPAGATL